MPAQRAEPPEASFTAYDRAQVNKMLEKAQLYLQSFHTQSDALQTLWQDVVLLQIHLAALPVKEE